jgi:hypothetical protein
LRCNILLNTTSTGCDGSECCTGCRADSDRNSGNAACLFFLFASLADNLGVRGPGDWCRCNILCGLGLGGDCSFAVRGSGGLGLAICASRKLLQEFLASLSGWYIYSDGVLAIGRGGRGRRSRRCAFIRRIWRLCRFVAAAVLVVVVDIVRVFALVIALVAVVKMTEVAEFAVRGHIVRHGTVTWVWCPAWESSARSWATGWEGAARLRRIRTNIA